MKTSYAPPQRALLEAKQDSVRELIGEHATQLFFEKGYQETTIEDIARAAGIGRRTFFRYFKAKDDVLLWGFDQFAHGVLARIGERPKREPPLAAMQHALLDASAFYAQQPERTLAILRLTERTPSLHAQQLLQQNRWKSWFASALRQRARFAESAMAPELIASIALEAMAVAVRRWIAADSDVPLTRLIGDAFAALGKLVGEVGPAADPPAKRTTRRPR